MSANDFDAFNHATHTAHVWLDEVAHAFDTDRQFAYRALRAWLHTLRDRLTVNSATDFAAQLPELLRGVYYDGWQPATVPVKYGPDEYRLRFAHEAGIPIGDVDEAAGIVTAALRARLSPGQLDHVLALLPEQLRTIVQGRPQQPAPAQPARATAARPGEPTDQTVEEQIRHLRAQIVTLTEAVRTLAHGLEQAPYDEPGSQRASQAARRAHELLLSPINTTATAARG